MAGKMIFISDDSILGFAFVYLYEQCSLGKTNKKTLTKEEFDLLKLNIKEYAKRNASAGDIIQEIPNKKEYFTTQELRTGVRETIFYYDPNKKVYYTTKPLGYLQAAYNRRNSDDAFMYNMYNNKEILSQLIGPESNR